MSNESVLGWVQRMKDEAIRREVLGLASGSRFQDFQFDVGKAVVIAVPSPRGQQACAFIHSLKRIIMSSQVMSGELADRRHACLEVPSPDVEVVVMFHYLFAVGELLLKLAFGIDTSRGGQQHQDEESGLHY